MGGVTYHLTANEEWQMNSLRDDLEQMAGWWWIVSIRGIRVLHGGRDSRSGGGRSARELAVWDWGGGGEAGALEEGRAMGEWIA